jgi:ubiquinone/menaquinone biosynthesis C-methylase UbiE
MIYRLSKLSILKHKLSTPILTSNLNQFGLKLRNFHLSKMESVSEAARGWSNPGVSNIYEKTRPDYNLDSVEFLLEKVGALKPHLGPEPFTIVELGAGTGKFTRAVLKVFEKHAVKNFKIIATEPLKEMCEKFKEMVPNVEILQCPASDLEGMYLMCSTWYS